MPSKQPLLPIIQAFVKSKNLKTLKEDDDSVYMVFGEQGAEDPIENQAVVLRGRDKEGDLTVSVVCLAKADKEKRKIIAEVFARANYGMRQYVALLPSSVPPSTHPPHPLPSLYPPYPPSILPLPSHHPLLPSTY